MARPIVREKLSDQYTSEDYLDQWVKGELVRGEAFESFGIEKQLSKLREYAGWLTVQMVAAGIIAPQEVLEHFGRERVCTVSADND